MQAWLPIGLGLVVLLAGVGTVLSAWRRAAAAPPVEHGHPADGFFSSAADPLRAVDQRGDDVRTVLWCGIGISAAGLFLIVVSAVLLLQQ